MPAMKKVAKGAGGRPKKKYGRKDFPVGAKLTAEEKARFDRAADASRMTAADFIRHVLNEAADRILGKEGNGE